MTAVTVGRTLVRAGAASLLVRRRSVVVAAGLLAVLAGAVLASLCVGSQYVAPQDVLRALAGNGTPYDVVVRELRLPRTVLAVVVGAAFGVAGALIQSVSRNPLASPDVIGITQGAGLAATVALTTSTKPSMGPLPWPDTSLRTPSSSIVATRFRSSPSRSVW